ncbi:trehalose-phosphatase [Alsobacter sp. SYSU M60028]|uniref:Trehalose 6-phosphate phosphatase n=1 Tax=Alsobacter ponti TaxID=2962936 RepID=A0ABT1LA01_9HYPH|nr:trehalose-phosphatase [Alsobacter ponti]MCP8938335.1 trehalose-phosphatase [Alsobacter ponti]
MPDDDLTPPGAWTSPPALFLDFDGTLVAIAPTPDAVEVAPDLAGVLARLRARLDGALAIVTGRPVAAIDDFLAPQRFDVAGLHGAELRLVGEGLRARPAAPALRDSVSRLRAAEAGGLVVEDKGRSVAVHWRLAPRREEMARIMMQREAELLGPGWRLQEGKSVLELLPAGASKGAAIAGLMTRRPYAGRTPIFIGDDVTDEHGFAEVDAAGGVSVRVGPGESRARRRIADPAALLACLRRWAAGGEPPFQEDRPEDRS